MKPICANCKYVHTEDQEIFACRRFPPQMFEAGYHEFVSRFPQVRGNWWCGEFDSGDNFEKSLIKSSEKSLEKLKNMAKTGTITNL